MASPDVSVIIATYNRSAVLHQVLAALRAQTCTDWEALIVGDACTDDTETMVADFADPRLRFINLPENHGEQSAPNNEGVRLSRGRLLAYLNHDDLWRPDHLETVRSHLEACDGDLAYGWTANLLPDETVALLGVSPGGRYSPAVIVPASAWVFRRELAERVGPWRSGWSMRLPPSQDWLLRAFRAGARMREVPRVSVIGFPSGVRPGAYTRVDTVEQERWRARLAADPTCVETLLARYVRAQTDGGRLPATSSIFGQLPWAIKNAAAAAAERVNVHPLALQLAVRHPGKGGFLRWLRRQRGLPPKGV